MGRRAALDEFYGLIGDLERRSGGHRRLAECDGRMDWPRRGAYFFFEEGEYREDGVTLRVVRVGTHALRPSSSTLWGRLSQHRGTQAGGFAGGGNHRGSVFRLHVGTALLESGDWPAIVRQTWAVGASAGTVTRRNEHDLEVAVSDTIGRMPFLWLAVDDPPGPSSDRGTIERGAISLLSSYSRPAIDPPSAGWLGRHAASEAVRESGLWNVNHVLEPWSDGFLGALEARLLSSP